jgi:hypothetical protein
MENEFGRCQFCGSYYYDNIDETGYCSDCQERSDVNVLLNNEGEDFNE